MYDPHFYCAGCGKQLGTMSHVTIDTLSMSHYDDALCRACEQEELAYLSQDDDDDSDLYSPLDDEPDSSCCECGDEHWSDELDGRGRCSSCR